MVLVPVSVDPDDNSNLPNATIRHDIIATSSSTVRSAQDTVSRTDGYSSSSSSDTQLPIATHEVVCLLISM